MKTTIDVANRREADDIRAGLEDPSVRAIATVMGALSRLPSDRARVRVLQYVNDRLSETTATTEN